MTKQDANGNNHRKEVLFEDFFTSMLNSVTESAFLMKRDGVVLAANDTVALRLGFSRGEDLVGKSMYDILPQEVTEVRRARVAEVILTGKPVRFEDERSGRRILNSIYPVFDSSGEVTRLSIFGMDITDQRVQEERLSLLGEMVDRAPASITIHDTEGKFIYVNRETLRLHGYTEEEFLSINLKNLDVPESAELIEERMRLIYEKGEASFDSAHFHRDGSVIPVHVVAKKLDWKGMPAFMSIATDIRESKKAEQALRENEEFTRAVMDNLPIGIAVNSVDSKVDFSYINEKFVETYRTTREAISRNGSFWESVYEDPEFREKIRKRVLEDCASGDKARMQWDDVPVRRGSDTFYISARNTPVPGKPLMISTVWDVTGLKKAEDDLRHTLDRLRRVTGSVIQVIVMAVESRDPYTAGHQRRVGDLARSIAFEMGLTPGEAEGIRIAGVIHDLGKISVPAEILSKPSQLKETEFAIVREHAQKGYEILKGVDFDWPIAEMIHQHHERIDGSGYPQGLKGNDIIQGARILAVADVVEAMASHRPYRPTLGIEDALSEIEGKRGVLYDAEVVDACLDLFRVRGYRLIEV